MNDMIFKKIDFPFGKFSDEKDELVAIKDLLTRGLKNTHVYNQRHKVGLQKAMSEEDAAEEDNSSNEGGSIYEPDGFLKRGNERAASNFMSMDGSVSDEVKDHHSKFDSIQ